MQLIDSVNVFKVFSLPMNKIGFENITKDEVDNFYYGFYSVEDELKYGKRCFAKKRRKIKF